MTIFETCRSMEVEKEIEKRVPSPGVVMMVRNVRMRAWIETAAAAISGILFVITLIWRDWIERVFGVDPDMGSGALEWVIVALALCATVAFSLLARTEWRKIREHPMA
ncbi:ABC transporter permease [Streptomyces griseorubiginosus]|uniref:ABC transporter permease n=1 Tax=Streptomyces griseorubiginosus TaxID=67304 RepID=UPI0036EC39B3